MTTYVALLRSINVGGHTVTMDRLRALFEMLQLSNVATFIASGNVMFEAEQRSARALEQEIETHLRTELGYEVTTFVRTTSELARIAAHLSFSLKQVEAKGSNLYIAFTKRAPSKQAKMAVETFASDVDELRVHGSEIYWLRRVGMGDRAHPPPPLERILGAPVTVRNANTVQRISAKFPAQ